MYVLCMTIRLPSQVNYVLDAHWYRESSLKILAAEIITYPPTRYGMVDGQAI